MQANLWMDHFTSMVSERPIS